MNKVSFSYLFPFSNVKVSRYQTKNVFLGSYLDNWWHRELYLQSSSNAMTDREKGGENRHTKTWISVLSMNGEQLHLYLPTHASIYLGVLLMHMQNLIWQVNFTPTLRQVCSVILLQIICLQLHVNLSFHW